MEQDKNQGTTNTDVSAQALARAEKELALNASAYFANRILTAAARKSTGLITSGQLTDLVNDIKSFPTPVHKEVAEAGERLLNNQLTVEQAREIELSHVRAAGEGFSIARFKAFRGGKQHQPTAILDAILHG